RNRLNMPMERFRKIIGQLQAWEGARLKVLKLSLYGEPLMNASFCEMLQIAREADIAERIETTTNASLLTGAIAEKLVEYRLDYARVSIYAPSQYKHEKITGSKMDIRSIHENLRILQESKKLHKSEKPFVSAKMLDRYDEDNDRFIQMYRDVADELYIDKPHNWIKTGDADFMKDFYQDGISAAVDDLKRHSTRRIACPMAFTTMSIRSNGDVSPCCVDFIGGTNLGNVDEGSLREIWYSDRWLEFQKMQLHDRKHENYSCARCDIYLSDHYTRDNIDGFPVERLRRKNSS
ncbi:MAG: SPASM domain-containing protein, partial [Elusimicrobiota bacterium]